MPNPPLLALEMPTPEADTPYGPALPVPAPAPLRLPPKKLLLPDGDDKNLELVKIVH